MNQTLADLRTEALAHGFDASTYTSRMNNWINEAQYLIARRCNFYGEEQTYAFSTTANTAKYPWPADFARMRSLDDLDRQIELQYVDLRDIDRSINQTGTPNFYAINGQNIELYPTPDSSTHNLQMRYWTLPSQLVNDTDQPTFLPIDWRKLLWEYAVWQGYEAEDDAAMGQYWQTRFTNDLAMFEADVKFPDSDGPNQVRGMWDPEPSLSPNGWGWWVGYW